MANRSFKPKGKNLQQRPKVFILCFPLSNINSPPPLMQPLPQTSPSSSLSPSAFPQSILEPFTQSFWQITPDKIFHWNPDGKYLSYHCLNPQAQHFTGPENILGQYIQDILPSQPAKQTFSVLRVAWLSHQVQFSTIYLPLGTRFHRVDIRFIPKDPTIMGLVNDYSFP